MQWAQKYLTLPCAPFMAHGASRKFPPLKTREDSHVSPSAPWEVRPSGTQMMFTQSAKYPKFYRLVHFLNSKDFLGLSSPSLRARRGDGAPCVVHHGAGGGTVSTLPVVQTDGTVETRGQFVSLHPFGVHTNRKVFIFPTRTSVVHL